MLPHLIITVDPDATRTAVALAVLENAQVQGAKSSTYRYLGSQGGGASRTLAPWQSVAGQLAWLDETLGLQDVVPGRTLVAVETQGAHSQHSREVEGLRRVRYHFEAACELRGISFKSVAYATWFARFVPRDQRPRGRGAQKKAYQSRARELTFGETTNEDRCAAFGMLWSEIVEKKCELLIESA